jgi:carbamoyltransferase
MTAILGVCAFCRDSAAALVVDGEVVAAAQEERFSREKQDERFPTRAVAYCLSQAGLTAAGLDHVAFHAKPLLEFERLLETQLACAPRGFREFLRAVPPWLTQRIHVPRELDRALAKQHRNRYVFTEHHESHAASAFFPSPFEEAAILAVDGVGEWATTSLGLGRGNRVELLRELRFPHSLGLLYAAFAAYCGFAEGDEHELMDLAPYGEPRHRRTILEHLVDLKEDGSFRLDIECLEACRGPRAMRRLELLFGGPARASGAPLTEREMDVAASIQDVTEEVLLRAARHLHERTGLANLCLAGGVALNGSAVGRIAREGPFERIKRRGGDSGLRPRLLDPMQRGLQLPVLGERAFN